MARVVQLTSPAPQGGFLRLQHASATVGRASAVGALLFALAATGALAFRLTGGLRQAFTVWREARRQRDEERKLWDLALADSRVMADLVALKQHTAREARRYS